LKIACIILLVVVYVLIQLTADKVTVNSEDDE